MKESIKSIKFAEYLIYWLTKKKLLAENFPSVKFIPVLQYNFYKNYFIWRNYWQLVKIIKNNKRIIM